jgi:hypothetical protein
MYPDTVIVAHGVRLGVGRVGGGTVSAGDWWFTRKYSLKARYYQLSLVTHRYLVRTGLASIVSGGKIGKRPVFPRIPRVLRRCAGKSLNSVVEVRGESAVSPINHK